jgi:hypothetical protein
MTVAKRSTPVERDFQLPGNNQSLPVMRTIAATPKAQIRSQMNP